MSPVCVRVRQCANVWMGIGSTAPRPTTNQRTALQVRTTTLHMDVVSVPNDPEPTTHLVPHVDPRRQHFGGGLDVAPRVELIEPWTRTVDHGGGGNLEDGGWW